MKPNKGYLQLFRKIAPNLLALGLGFFIYTIVTDSTSTLASRHDWSPSDGIINHGWFTCNNTGAGSRDCYWRMQSNNDDENYQGFLMDIDTRAHPTRGNSRLTVNACLERWQGYAVYCVTHFDDYANFHRFAHEMNLGNLTDVNYIWLHVRAKRSTSQTWVRGEGRRVKINRLNIRGPDEMVRGDSKEICWGVTNIEDGNLVRLVDDRGRVVNQGGPPNRCATVRPDQTTTYTLEATGPGRNGPETVTDSVRLFVYPPHPSVTIWADDQRIAYNSSTMLHWRSQDADSCYAHWLGRNVVRNGDRSTGRLTSDQTFRIICSNSRSAASDQVTVKVDPPPPLSVSISADRSPIGWNESTIIHWNSSNATSCSDPFGGSSTRGDRDTGNLTSNQTYTITCNGEGGQRDSKSFTVSVNPRPGPTASIRADSNDVSYNGSTTIRWSSSNADSCSINHFGGVSPNTSDSRGTGNLTSTRTYTITCRGNGETSASDTVRVGGPQLSLYVRGDGGGRADSSPGGIRNCRFTGDNPCVAEFPAGSRVTINASPDGRSRVTNWRQGWRPGNNGTPVCGTSNSCSITMNGPQSLMVQMSRLVAPSVTLTANPPSVPYNGSTTLTWTVNAGSGVNSCTASGDWSGSKAIGGGNEVMRNLTSNRSYRIQCTGPGGNSNTAVANVTVARAVPPSISFSASPTRVDYNESTTLSWSVSQGSGVNSCSASGNWSGSKSTTSGSETMRNLTSNRSYTLTCTGPGGSDRETVSVTVNPAEGDINVRATLNGSSWQGSVSYQLRGPQTINGSSVETQHDDVRAGTYTISHRGGGPSASSLSSISPRSSQSFGHGGSVVFTLNFISNPPSAPSGLSANNSTCEALSLSWRDNSNNEQGFRIYRGTSSSLTLLDTVGANTTSYNDTSVSGGTSYWYGVAAYNQGGESSQSNTGPVFVSQCTPNLALSSMSVTQVNGQSYSGQTIKNGDTVTFQVLISNTGTAPAYDVYVDSTLTANLNFAGNPRLNSAGISSSGSGQNITFDSGRNLGDKPAGGSNWILTFDTTVNSSAQQAVDFFKGDGAIRYSLTNGGSQNQTRNVSSGLIPLRTGTVQIPNIREVAP